MQGEKGNGSLLRLMSSKIAILFQHICTRIVPEGDSSMNQERLSVSLSDGKTVALPGKKRLHWDISIRKTFNLIL